MDLTIISFAIAVVGIVLQLADAFPAHREVRQTIFLLSIGMFLGALLSALTGAHYSITGNVNASYVILFALIGAAILFGLIAIVMDSEIALYLAGAAGFIFILSGIGIGLTNGPVGSRYSAEEVLLLADQAEKNGQAEKAIDRLKELGQMVKSTAASDKIQARIERLEASQAGH